MVSEINNPTIESPQQWSTEEGLKFTELIRQQYSNCCFSAGVVQGDDVDTVYLKLEKVKTNPILLLLRPDELAAIAWVSTGVVWSLLLEQLPKSCTNTAKS